MAKFIFFSKKGDAVIFVNPDNVCVVKEEGLGHTKIFYTFDDDCDSVSDVVKGDVAQVAQALSE